MVTVKWEENVLVVCYAEMYRRVQTAVKDLLNVELDSNACIMFLLRPPMYAQYNYIYRQECIKLQYSAVCNLLNSSHIYLCLLCIWHSYAIG